MHSLEMDNEAALSVRQRRQLFESASAPAIPTRATYRGRSESVVPRITISEEATLTVLEPRPELDDAPVIRRTPPPRQKKPRRLQTAPGLVPHNGLSDPGRILLYENDSTENSALSDDCELNESREALSPEPVESRASSPSTSPRRSIKDYAREAQKRTQLLVGSALTETQKTAGIVRRKSQDAASDIERNTKPLISRVGQNFDEFGTATSQIVKSTGVPDVVEVVARGVKGGAAKVKIGAEGFAEQLGIPSTFAGTKQDIQDIKARYGRKDGLCSHCRSLPVQLCFPKADRFNNTELDAEIIWATPLARVIYHSNWCRMCNLFLEMLSRDKHDPLRHPLVAPSLPDAVKGMSFRQWVAKGWYWTDNNWPFGQGDQRGEYATKYLGLLGSTLSEGSKKALALGVVVTGVSVYALSIATLGNHNRQYRKPAEWTSVRDRVDNAKKLNEKAQYPLSCVLQIRMRTNADFESPGLMLTELVGFGNGGQAQPEALSTFMLRVARPGAPERPLSIGPLSYGRFMDPSWIDLRYVRSCLAACEQDHGQICSRHGWAVAMKQPEMLRVIDVRNLCIVTPSQPQSCRYVALSYVWGNAQSQMPKLADIDSLSRIGALRRYLDRMPRTITDAIEVVHAIGEQYLWVDSLCILQHNMEDKLSQIATMDRIYGSALLTIVAADGEHASDGLRGVRRNHLEEYGSGIERSSDQTSARLEDDYHLIAPFANPQNVEKSAWNQRAWCFQERVLSKRFLIFGSNEATWHCPAMTAREDMLVKDSGYGQPLPGRLSLTPQHLGIDIAHENWRDGSLENNRFGETKLVRCARFHEYSKMISQYTHRKMTKDTDMINALAGLLRIFELAFKCDMTFGLPEVLLDVALLWGPAERLTRREGQFPSWSWAGWKGHVAYESPFILQKHRDHSPSRLMHDNYGEEGVRPFLRWHRWSRSAQTLFSINGTGVGIPLQTSDYPREWEKVPQGFASGGIINQRPDASLLPVPSSLLQDHHLIFWTSASCAFTFGDETAQTSDHLQTLKPPPVRRAIADADFEWAGTILLDGPGPDWLDPARHEFILIAEAQYYKLDDEARDIEGYPLYLVMLIEYDQQTKIAERRGLGRIKKQAWRQAQTEKKLVVLG